uniref:putative invertase inhibitor n=1 Tax=Erigeron canadensis TaxID=72917 RepID=UPI001CB8BE05|nr:putative invertase inhibitor [Erigeron canadensis]
MTPSSSLLFIFFFFLSFSTHAQTLIHGTCKLCSQQDPGVDYQFCATSLQAAPGSHHANIRGLGKISIRLTKKNMTDTRFYIRRLLNNYGVNLSTYARMRLNDCLELYSDSITDIKSAFRNYKASRFDEANLLLSAVMEAANTCENGFKEMDNIVSPLTKRNDATFDLSAIALAIIHILQVGINSP